jgi:hypothetical protein
MSKRTNATPTGLPMIHEGREPRAEGTTRRRLGRRPRCLSRSIDREEGPGAETSIRSLAGILEEGDDTVPAGAKWPGKQLGGRTDQANK